jgi:hypothetical protein
MTTSGIEEIDLQNLNKDLIDGINGTIYSSLSNQNSILHSFIKDGNISSAFFDTKISCYVGYVLPTGYVAQPYRMRFYPKLRSATLVNHIVYEASSDGET